MNLKITISTLFACFILFSTSIFSQNGLNFDGTNDLVQSTFPGVLGSANRTFEAWVNVNSTSTSNNCIIDYGANAVGSRNTFMVNSSFGLSYISGGTNANIGSTGATVTAGQWNHVAFVLNNGTGYLYLNGVQVGTGSLTSVNTPTGATSVRIGERVSGGSTPFAGSIDEVRVWDYARSQTEIANSMNNDFCSIPAGLVAYFKLDQGVAAGTNTGLTTAINEVNSAQNGTLTNMSLTGATSNWVTGAPITIAAPTTATLNIANACGSYISPSGNDTFTLPGMYMDTIPNTTGCDSIITINLAAVSSNSFAAISATACNTYTTPSGNSIFTANGSYIDTIPSTSGCDSILTINLTILESFASLNVFGCEDYVAPSGAVYSSSGTYMDTIANSAGCDSIMTLNLVLLGSSQSSFTTESCFEYTTPSGKLINETGTYLDTLTSVLGCDSILTINLTINKFTQTVNKTSNALISSVLNATYQWYDCSKDEIIVGQTAQSYVPIKDGSFAVIVTKNGCTDTSDCIVWSKVGIESIEISSDLVVYPNPTSGNVRLSLKSGELIQSILILNIEGRAISVKEGLNENEIALNMSLAAGLYFVRVADQNNETYFSRLIVE